MLSYKIIPETFLSLRKHSWVLKKGEFPKQYSTAITELRSHSTCMMGTDTHMAAIVIQWFPTLMVPRFKEGKVQAIYCIYCFLLYIHGRVLLVGSCRGSLYDERLGLPHPGHKFKPLHSREVQGEKKQR